MSEKNEWILWENDEMSLQAAFNPAIPREEGFHLVLLQKTTYKERTDKIGLDGLVDLYIPQEKASSPWADPEPYSRMSLVAAKVSGIITRLGEKWCQL